MKFKVYKSLDRSVQIFGIKGRYLYIMAIAAVISAVAALAIGKALGGLVGLLSFFVLFFASAMVLIAIQSSVSEKDLFIKVSMTRCPHGIRVKPKRLVRGWK